MVRSRVAVNIDPRDGQGGGTGEAAGVQNDELSPAINTRPEWQEKAAGRRGDLCDLTTRNAAENDNPPIERLSHKDVERICGHAVRKILAAGETKPDGVPADLYLCLRRQCAANDE